MKINVVRLSYSEKIPPTGYWDHGLIDDLLNNKLYQTDYEFEHHISQGSFPKIDSRGVVIVMPARAQSQYIDRLNKDILKFDWVIILFTGDEENVFPYDEVEHPNCKIWVMSPRKGMEFNKLGTGYPHQIHDYDKELPNKDIDWFFSGQITHKQRIKCANQLRLMSGGVLNETDGFTKGFLHNEYYKNLSSAKVAPAPSGPETPDTFRVFEALEMAAVPIVDEKDGDFKDYWNFFFDTEVPFPVLRKYEQLPGYINDTVKKYPMINNRVFAWWMRYKRRMSNVFNKQLNDMAGLDENNTVDHNTTVLVPVSAIKSHPDISILDETIKSIRHHLPTAEIIITFDGIRKEQENKRSDYEEFIRRILWKCDKEYRNVLPLIFESHTHQVGMAREALKYVRTPLILYVEQDTPLVTDEEIEWDSIIHDLLLSYTNMIRFHFEAVIPEPHKRMIHGFDDKTKTRLIKTSQWSQRPHISSTAFYKRILRDHFSEDAKSFIEDKMHSVLDCAYNDDGLMGWEQFKVHIYAPDGNHKRSYHTDGRDGEEKYDNTQIF